MNQMVRIITYLVKGLKVALKKIGLWRAKKGKARSFFRRLYNQADLYLRQVSNGEMPNPDGYTFGLSILGEFSPQKRQIVRERLSPIEQMAQTLAGQVLCERQGFLHLKSSEISKVREQYQELREKLNNMESSEFPKDAEQIKEDSLLDQEDKKMRAEIRRLRVRSQTCLMIAVFLTAVEVALVYLTLLPLFEGTTVYVQLILSLLAFAAAFVTIGSAKVAISFQGFWGAMGWVCFVLCLVTLNGLRAVLIFSQSEVSVGVVALSLFALWLFFSVVTFGAALMAAALFEGWLRLSELAEQKEQQYRPQMAEFEAHRIVKEQFPILEQEAERELRRMEGKLRRYEGEILRFLRRSHREALGQLRPEILSAADDLAELYFEQKGGENHEEENLPETSFSHHNDVWVPRKPQALPPYNP